MDAELRALDAAGFRAAPGGQALLSGAAERLLRAWSDYLCRLLDPSRGERYAAPLLIDHRTLADARYLQHFPQNVLPAGSHAEREPDVYLTPAACLHLYPMLAGRGLPPQGFTALIHGLCARREGGAWAFPFRLSAFHMLELVAAGTEEFVRAERDRAESAVGDAFSRLGLGGRFQPAADAFFLGNDEGARLIQKLKGLKREYIVPLGGEEVALGSVNSHEDTFGRCFGITLPGCGGPAFTCCAAFGLERLVACGLLLWGADPAGWPPELHP